MAEVFYRVRWIPRQGQLNSLLDVRGLAMRHGCVIYSCGPEDDYRSPEGYAELRYVVKAPSDEIFTSLYRDVQSIAGFTDWEPITQEFYDRTTHWFGEIPRGKKPSINDTSFPNGEYETNMFKYVLGTVHHNRTLENLLSQGKALHFVCKWIVPDDVTINQIPERSELPNVWYVLYLDFVLRDAMDADEKLGVAGDKGIGRELRAGDTGINAEGNAYQKLLMRVFNRDEMQQFEQLTEHLHLGEWVETTADEYLEGYVIKQYSFMRFYETALQLAEHNRA